jgi:hypothetical protein
LGLVTEMTAWDERENALEVLDDVTHWAHLSPVGWVEIDALVAAMSSAVDSEDWKAARDAVIETELTSPCRCRQPPADAMSTPPATRTAVLELMEKIRSNTRSTNATSST